MSAGAELSAQIGRIKEAIRPLAKVIDELGTGLAEYAIVDSGNRTTLRALARDLEEMTTYLDDKASECGEPEDE